MTVDPANHTDESDAVARPRGAPDAEAAALRIAVFTHDTFGLGHVRRCRHIIEALTRRLPRAAILLVSGNPSARAFEGLPANVDWLRLPTVVSTGRPETRPPHLPIGRRAVLSLRKRILRGALDSFEPDLLLVDNFPLGSGRELLPTLERLRERSVTTVLGLRDIVDRPEIVRATWTKDRVYDVLLRLYDRVLVYGRPEIFDVGEAYALPPETQARVRYCGYVTSAAAPTRGRDEIRAELGADGPLVLATVGGGGDGFPLLSNFVQAVHRCARLSAVAITGPLMAAGDRERLRELAGGHARIAIRDSVTDLPSYLAAADLVVAMGGYNTVSELLALRRWALVVPRNWRYGEYAAGTRAGLEWEQLLRAQALERLGLLRVVPPESLDPAALAREIDSGLQHEPPTADRWPAVTGVEQAASEIRSLLEARVRGVPV